MESVQSQLNVSVIVTQRCVYKSAKSLPLSRFNTFAKMPQFFTKSFFDPIQICSFFESIGRALFFVLRPYLPNSLPSPPPASLLQAKCRTRRRRTAGWRAASASCTAAPPAPPSASAPWTAPTAGRSPPTSSGSESREGDDGERGGKWTVLCVQRPVFKTKHSIRTDK